jgi:hypothetical protein
MEGNVPTVYNVVTLSVGLAADLYESGDASSNVDDSEREARI